MLPRYFMLFVRSRDCNILELQFHLVKVHDQRWTSFFERTKILRKGNCSKKRTMDERNEKLSFLKNEQLFLKKRQFFTEMNDFQEQKFSYIFLYLYIVVYTLLVWVFVCLYPINVKTAELIGPNFVWVLTRPKGRFIDNQYFKNLPSTYFFIKSDNFFIFCFTMKRKSLQLKLKMGAKHPESLVYNKK